MSCSYYIYLILKKNWKKFVGRECGKLDVFCYGLGLDPILVCKKCIKINIYNLNILNTNMYIHIRGGAKKKIRQVE